jgi:hypothetical protein
MTFLLLPREIIEIICQYLNAGETCRLSISCKYINQRLDKVLINKKDEYINVNPVHYCKYFVEKNYHSLLLDKLKLNPNQDIIWIAVNEFIKMDKFGMVDKLIRKFKLNPIDLLDMCLPYHSWQVAGLARNQYSCTLNRKEIYMFIDTDFRVTQWIFHQPLILPDMEMINYLITKNNFKVLEFLHKLMLIPQKTNEFMINSLRANNLKLFVTFEKWGYKSPKKIFDDIAKFENLLYSFYLYRKGYVGKSKLYLFMGEENQDFIFWLIKNNISYSTFKNNLDNFNIKELIKYHDNGSLNSLYHFYLKSPKEIIKLAMKDNYITQEEIEQNLKLVNRKL